MLPCLGGLPLSLHPLRVQDVPVAACRLQLLARVCQRPLMLVRVAQSNAESTLDVLELRIQGFAFLSGPIDLTVGAILHVAGIALLFETRVFGLLTDLLHLLVDLGQLRARFVTLSLKFVALPAQVVDLRLALSQQLLQIDQSGLHTSLCSNGFCRLLASLSNVQTSTRFQLAQGLAFFVQDLALAGQGHLGHALGQERRLLPYGDKGLRHLRRQAW